MYENEVPLFKLCEPRLIRLTSFEIESLCYHKYILYELYNSYTIAYTNFSKCGHAMHKSNTNVHEYIYTYLLKKFISLSLCFNFLFKG